MKYIIEQYKWDETDGEKYYHLVDSSEFETDKSIPPLSYHKNGSYFTIMQFDDEVQTAPRRTKQRTRQNIH